MPEHDALVLAYSHLRDFPRASDALQILRRVASLVKPLMRARNWKVRELSEFYPDQANLLGLNINRGQKILLRLRYANDTTLFLPTEQIADTMLHELAHIVHGPHDATFHALWNQLRDEHMALAIKGYTGENFLSDGHRLGGGGGGGGGSSNRSSNHGHRHSSSSSASSSSQRSAAMAEARRLARAAAERRQRSSDKDRSRSSTSTSTSSSNGGGGGRRLGGSGPAPSAANADDLRRVVAEAVARRNSHTSQALTGCATDGPQYSDQTRAVLVEQASRNGFHTQAEEDAANDAAIAQALWELVQEDEKRRLGGRYVPPTAEHPEGSGGWLTAHGDGLSPIVIDDDEGEDDHQSSKRAYDAPPRPPTTTSRRPVSMSSRPPKPPPPRSIHLSRPRSSSSSTARAAASQSASSTASARGWVCHVCTLHNPRTFLCCDACGTERRAVESTITSTSMGREEQPSAHRHAPPIPYATHPSLSSSSSLAMQRPPPPPPPPSRAAAQANPASSSSMSSSSTAPPPGRTSALAPHSHHRPPKSKKKVSFTPSTCGGSVTSLTSTSARVAMRRPVSVSAPAPAPAPAPIPPPVPAAFLPLAETWMCTNCWGHMSVQLAGCAQCGKPRERWQGR